MNRYLTELEKIHSVVLATVDDDGLPATCVVDVMLADEGGLYFLTGRGKSLYARLSKHPEVALTALKGESTITSISISVRGRVREIGSARIPEIFEKNPYMAKIYPSEAARSALTVFQLYEGSGEFFDLSVRPIFRERFAFGGAEAKAAAYEAGPACDACGECARVCPQSCIDASAVPARIAREHCLLCGKCAEVCPNHAIRRVVRSVL